MQTNRFAKKLNNDSGSSIMMALLLLLVATVVSVVIVAVALTSTMHVDDNRTSQQEYLACVSVAEMLRDGLDGSTSIRTVTTTTVDYWFSDKNDTTTVSTPKYSSTPKNSKMKALVESTSKKIFENDSAAEGDILIQDKEFSVSVSNMNPEAVDGCVKLICTGERSYELKFKFKAGDDSKGYRMSMVIPIEMSKPTDATSSKDSYSSLKTTTTTTTTTTITWGGSGAKTKISKGWGAYES